MILINRLIPFISSFLVFIFFQFLFSFPKITYFALPLLILIIFFSIFELNQKKIDKKFFDFFLPLLFYQLSVFLFFVFLIPLDSFLKYLLLIIFCFFNFLYLENIFQFLYQTGKFFEITSYLNLISFFLFSSFFFYLNIFTNLPSIFLPLLFILIVIPLNYFNFTALEGRVIVFIFILSLILTQIFFALTFFPTSLYTNALFLTTLSFLFTDLTKYSLKESLGKEIIRRDLIIALIALIIVLLTTKWV